jgi:RecA/RadA recombinase
MSRKTTTTSSLNSILGKFNTTMGEGIVHTASDMPECLKIRSTIPMYNYVTDGGFPVGRIIEHYGENGSLKSYLFYDAIGQFQRFDWANNEPNAFVKFEYAKEGVVKELLSYKLRRGYKPEREPEHRRVALVDIEGTYTQEWGENFGIDNEGLIIVNPVMLSQAVDITQALLSDPTISLVIIDSLSAIGPDDETDKSMEDQQMASNARFWNKAFRKFQSAINSNPHGQATLGVVNSEYTKVGLVFGDPSQVKNGGQLKRAKSLSVFCKPLKEIQGEGTEGDLIVGRNISLTCKKNKLGTNGRSGTLFYAYVDYGAVPAHKTNTNEQIVELGLRYGIVERKGSWYSYGDLRVQGMDNLAVELETSGLIKEIEDEILKQK